MLAAALSLLLIGQAPAPQDPRPLDVLELKNGDTLEGRITTEIDGYVELRLDAGSVVGISRTQIAAVRRGAGAKAPPAAPLPERSDWFVLHDASGAAVGWLHTSVTAAADGGVVLAEEYEFVQGQTRYQVTSLASADAQLQPRSCYFRERACEPSLPSVGLPNFEPAAQADHVVDERIVEATCRGDVLHVQRLDRSGRRERDLPWTTTASFPLLARALALRAGTATGERSLFDPATEELVLRRYDGSRRRAVVVDGQRAHVTEIAETSATGRNTEWVDASARVVRRELAGPSLVAVPSNADSAAHAVGAVTIPGARIAEAGGAFGLWVPNPAWVASEGLPAGQLQLTCAAHGASISLARLDHLEPGLSLDNAADAVANWFRLLHPGLRLGERDTVRVRDRQAIRLPARGKHAGVPTRAEVLVIPHRERPLALVCVAPTAAWDELAADIAFLQQSIELDEQALAPKLQGPLAPRPTNARPPTVPDATAAEPAKVPPAPKPASGPTVRVPGAL